jgi:hypothetical protein
MAYQEFQIRKRGGAVPAWQYRGSIIESWSFFPNEATASIDNMKGFLSKNYGDNPQLKFVDDTGQPATFAEVRRLPNGKTSVRLNGGEREHEIHSWDFWPVQEQYQFFRDRQSDETNCMALQKDLHDAIRFYKEQADPDTKKEFTETLAAKINDEAVTAILKAREGDAVKIFFNE